MVGGQARDTKRDGRLITITYGTYHITRVGSFYILSDSGHGTGT